MGAASRAPASNDSRIFPACSRGRACSALSFLFVFKFSPYQGEIRRGVGRLNESPSPWKGRGGEGVLISNTAPRTVIILCLMLFTHYLRSVPKAIPFGRLRFQKPGALPITFLLLIALLFLFGRGGAYAFHQGGVGECDGCHSMHNSFGGDPMTTDGGLQSNAYLLQGATQSGTCLICHERSGDAGPNGYNVSTPFGELGLGFPPKQRTPGGDFGWLRKNYNWLDEVGQIAFSHGERHGHNIIAPENDYVEDSENPAAPGGSYDSSKLHCTSCHDPHGLYRRTSSGLIVRTGEPIVDSGSFNTSPAPSPKRAVSTYMLLGGIGYAPNSYQMLPFAYDPPAAVAPDPYNRSEAGADTRVAYGMGMSEWCSNCHNMSHNPPDAFQHAWGELASMNAQPEGYPSPIFDIYNSYLATGHLTGDADGAYASLVPFETGALDHSLNTYSGLKALAAAGIVNGTAAAYGANAYSRVMCLSCHRAHASGWDNSLRWNESSTYLIYNGAYPGTDNEAPGQYAQGRAERETKAAYYDKPVTRFAAATSQSVTNQRSLCNKCHAQD